MIPVRVSRRQGAEPWRTLAKVREGFMALRAMRRIHRLVVDASTRLIKYLSTASSAIIQARPAPGVIT